MKKHVGIIMLLILASQLLLVPLQASPARADTRITITIAAGGVACGVYVFLRLAFRTLAPEQNPLDTAALFNHGPEGWRIQFPNLDLARGENNVKLPDLRAELPGKEELNLQGLRVALPVMAFPVNASETLQMDILRVRF